ncbi:hypothetical protein BGI51_20510 [Pseudomonas oryzihabitans]|nr:hypothetical protein BGI51_20510 [Pseudomonas psychrotolerans]
MLAVAAWVAKSRARTLSAKVRSKCSSLMLSNGANSDRPAAATARLQAPCCVPWLVRDALVLA